MKYSIIIPFYNAELFLEKCLLSLLNQSIDDSFYEILLIDDGSIDSSKTICESHIQDNVKYYYKKNGGPSSARNYGISMSRGDYIIFVDSDDWCDKDFLKIISEHIKNYDFLIHGYCVENKNGFYHKKPKNSIASVKNDYNFSNLILKLDGDGFFSSPWIGVFKRKIIIENQLLFNESLSFGEDTCFVYNYLHLIQNLVCINDSIYYYNNNNGDSITKKYINRRYPLCLVRFSEREKVYKTFCDTKKSNIQFCNLLTIEINNCFRNELLVHNLVLNQAVDNIFTMLNDSYIKKYYGKSIFIYKNINFVNRVVAIYLKIVIFLKNKRMIKPLARIILRRINE